MTTKRWLTMSIKEQAQYLLTKNIEVNVMGELKCL